MSQMPSVLRTYRASWDGLRTLTLISKSVLKRALITPWTNTKVRTSFFNKT